MKSFLVLSMFLSFVLSSHLAQAASVSQCEPFAKIIAQNEISDNLDIPSDVCQAEIQSLFPQKAGIYVYQFDVICGDATVASNHYSDQVVVYAGDCKDASPDQH